MTLPLQTIYTLEARDHGFLDTLKSHYKLDTATIYYQINKVFKDMVSVLEKKKIGYLDLKNALVPQSDRKEIAFVFDTNQIRSTWYGNEVFSILIPLFDLKSCHSVLTGDLIGRKGIEDNLKSEFLATITLDKQIAYQYSEAFYIVYINNLSSTQFSNIHTGLKQLNAYVGYFDLTYSSFMKTYLSVTLIRLFIKYRKTIIAGYEDGEDINVSGYAFEKNGYVCKNVESLYYELFLSYKIEREVYKGFEADTTFAINAITDNVFDISDFSILIEDAKLNYLLTAKKDNLVRAGFSTLTVQELQELIKTKINSNYIYNLRFRSDSQTLMFTIIIESIRIDKMIPVKLTVGLEYIPTQKILRVITLF